MTAGARDLNATLEYRSRAVTAKALPYGLLLIFLGLFIPAMEYGPRREVLPTLIGYGSLALGLVLAGLALWRRVSAGRPLFALSPRGVDFRIPLVTRAFIPWSEVKGVETVVIRTRFGSFWRGLWFWGPSGIPDTFRFGYNLSQGERTALVVASRFYESEIAPPPVIRAFSTLFLLSGADSWRAEILPDGEVVRVVLDHEAVSVDFAALREAVEARWTASPRQTPPSKAQAAISMDPGPAPPSTWDRTLIAGSLIGIVVMVAHYADAWDFPGAREEREKRARAQTERQRIETILERSREDSRRGAAEAQERWKRFDEEMRRNFGP